MIEFLVSCLVAAAVIYVLFLVLDMIPLPFNLKRIVQVIVGLLALVWFLNFTGIYHLNLHKSLF